MNGDFVARYNITVSKGGKIELAASEAEISVGKRVYIEFNASNGENVVWTIVGGDGQANISVDGSDLVVKGVKPGTVQIQGSFSDGSGAVTLTIYVTPGASSSVPSVPDSSSVPSSNTEEEPSSSSSETSLPNPDEGEEGGDNPPSVPSIWG